MSGHGGHHETHAEAPFDRKVAMTIAMVAACLAGVSLLGHRAHNDVLRLTSESSVDEINSSNGYAWYQAQRVRQAMLELNKTQLEIQPVPTDPEAKKLREKTLKQWEDKINEYKTELETRRKDAEKFKQDAKEKSHQAHFKHKQGNLLDIGHLAVELGLVFCSIAILTKRKSFWATGVLACLIGVGITTYVYVGLKDDHAKTEAHSH